MFATRRGTRQWKLGLGLLLYGVSGLLILVILATGIVRGLDRVQGLSASIEQQRRSLTVALEAASNALDSTATTVSGVHASLGQATSAVTNAGTLASDVATSMLNLASALNVTILGSQPFATTSAGFVQTATELQTLSAQLAATASALGSNGEDTLAVGRDLAGLRSAVDAVHSGLQAAPDTSVSSADLGTLRLVLLGLLAWLGVQAVAACALGAWLATRRQ